MVSGSGSTGAEANMGESRRREYTEYHRTKLERPATPTGHGNLYRCGRGLNGAGRGGSRTFAVRCHDDDSNKTSHVHQSQYTDDFLEV